MSGQVWRNEEIELLKEIYPKKENQEIVFILNRSIYSIHQKSRELKLYKTEEFISNKFSEVQKKYLENHKHCRVGMKHNKKSIDKMSISHLGKTPWNKNMSKDKLAKHYSNGWHNPIMKRKDNPMFEVKRYAEDNPNWKGEEGIHYDRLIFVKTIKKRDNYTCQLCGKNGKSKNLHAHHIDFNNKNHNLLNGITLCCPCHNSIKKNKKQNIIKLTKIVGDKYDFN